MTMSGTADKASNAGRWIALAAAPSLAAMALISALDAPRLALCAAGRTLLPIDGMTSMYLLMSLFHLPPWLKLVTRSLTMKGD